MKREMIFGFRGIGEVGIITRDFINCFFIKPDNKIILFYSNEMEDRGSY